MINTMLASKHCSDTNYIVAELPNTTEEGIQERIRRRKEEAADEIERSQN